jgi:hypothetical protein
MPDVNELKERLELKHLKKQQNYEEVVYENREGEYFG